MGRRTSVAKNWIRRATVCATRTPTSKSKPMNASSQARMRSKLSPVMMSWSTAPIIFLRAICRTTSAFLRKSQTFTDRFFVSMARRPCSRRIWAGLVIAAYFPSRRRRDRFQIAQAGVLGVLPGIVGTIQANEAIKLILGVGEPLVGRLLYFDALKMKFREFNLRR